jgi:hypothetical protein
MICCRDSLMGDSFRAWAGWPPDAEKDEPAVILKGSTFGSSRIEPGLD